MNWKLILSLAMFGLVTGGIAVLGFVSQVAPILYSVGLLLCTVLIVKKAGGRYGLHGVWVGALIGVIEALVGQLFVETYMNNNLELAEAYMWSFGLFFVIIGFIRAVTYGAALGFTGWLVGKLMGSRATHGMQYQTK